MRGDKWQSAMHHHHIPRLHIGLHQALQLRDHKAFLASVDLKCNKKGKDIRNNVSILETKMKHTPTQKKKENKHILLVLHD